MSLRRDSGGGKDMAGVPIIGPRPPRMREYRLTSLFGTGRPFRYIGGFRQPPETATVSRAFARRGHPARGEPAPDRNITR